MKIKQREMSLNGSFELYLKKVKFHIDWKIYLVKKPQLVFSVSNIILDRKLSSLEKESLSMKFLKPKIKKYWIDKILSINHVKNLIGNKKVSEVMWAKK